MKSYFASSVQAAMREARTELGPDAILVTSRPSAPEARGLGEFEVVFASDIPEQTPPSAPQVSTARPTPAAQAAALDEISARIRELRTHFAAWRKTKLYDSGQPSWIVGNEALEEAFTALIDAEVDRERVFDWMAKAHMRLRSAGAAPDPRRRLALSRGIEGNWGAAQVRAALSEEIRSVCSADSTLGFGGNGPKIVALVGPPGAGKTTTIAKLAVQYALPARKPSALISIDTFRVGASAPLRSYASILGLALSEVETTRGLAQAIEEHRGKEFIFIDTPGLGFRDMEHGGDLADFLSRRADIQTHLVLPASLRSSDLARMSAAFERFGASRLLFTRLDETEVFGPMLSEAARSLLPLSFVTDGQRVPEDMRSADAGELLECLLSPGARISQQLSAA